jgi:hypothetical protein
VIWDEVVGEGVRVEAETIIEPEEETGEDVGRIRLQFLLEVRARDVDDLEGLGRDLLDGSGEFVEGLINRKLVGRRDGVCSGSRRSRPGS